MKYFEITGHYATDILNLTKDTRARVIVIGEAHFDAHCSFLVSSALKECRPDFFLSEHFAYDFVPPEDIRSRINGVGRNGRPYNALTKHWLRTVAKYRIPAVGIDYTPPDGSFETFKEIVNVETLGKVTYPDSFALREDRMLEVIKEFASRGRILVQLGDSHLRTLGSDWLGKPSPIMEYLQTLDSAVVFRLNKNMRECE